MNLIRKIVLPLFVVALLSTPGLSQENVRSEFQKFRLNVGIGPAVKLPFEKDARIRFGAMVYVEPAWQATPKISIGLRFQQTSIIGLIDTETFSGLDEKQSLTIASNLVSGSYRFSTGKARWYVGMNAGYCNVFIEETPEGEKGWKAERVGTYGVIMPRVGIELGRLLIEHYSHLTTDRKSRFGGVSVGFMIWGSRK